MNNKDMYKETFSGLHSDYASMQEVLDKNKSRGGIRMKKSIAVVLCVLVGLFAMSAVAYAATDGQIFQDIKVFFNGEQVNANVDEDGNVEVNFDAGDEVKVENGDTTTDVKSGPFKGKVKVNTQTNEDTVELDEVVE